MTSTRRQNTSAITLLGAVNLLGLIADANLFHTALPLIGLTLISRPGPTVLRR